MSIFGKNFKEVEVSIEGMSCNHCTASVKKALSSLGGTKSVEVSLEKKQALVKFDEKKCDVKSIIDCINALGFKASLKK